MGGTGLDPKGRKNSRILSKKTLRRSLVWLCFVLAGTLSAGGAWASPQGGSPTSGMGIYHDADHKASTWYSREMNSKRRAEKELDPEKRVKLCALSGTVSLAVRLSQQRARTATAVRFPPTRATPLLFETAASRRGRTAQPPAEPPAPENQPRAPGSLEESSTAARTGPPWPGVRYRVRSRQDKDGDYP
jgi:hypothetical protein